MRLFFSLLADFIGRKLDSLREADDFKERNDEDWLFHTLAWLKDNSIKIGSRPVTLRAMSNEVQSFPPKARVY